MSDTPRQLESSWEPEARDCQRSPGVLRNPSAWDLPYPATRYVRSAVFDAEIERDRILAECDRAKAQAEEIRTKARETGLAEARAQVASLLGEVSDRVRRMQDDFEAEVLGTASALVQALLNVDDHFYDEAIASLVGAALASVRMDRTITIRTSRRAAPWIESLREDLLPSLTKAGDLSVVVDPELDDRSIRIDTEHGSRCFSLRARLRRLRASARRASEAPVRVAPDESPVFASDHSLAPACMEGDLA